MKEPIAVTLDTNIFIASLWGTKSRRVVELWKEGKIIIFASEAVLKEYETIINRFP